MAEEFIGMYEDARPPADPLFRDFGKLNIKHYHTMSRLADADALIDHLRKIAANELPMAAKNDHSEAVSLSTRIIDAIDDYTNTKKR